MHLNVYYDSDSLLCFETKAPQTGGQISQFFTFYNKWRRNRRSVWVSFGPYL